MNGIDGPLIGLFVGLLLGIAAAIGGFSAFIVAAVLGGVGYLVGAQLAGRLDLRELAGRGRG